MIDGLLVRAEVETGELWEAGSECLHSLGLSTDACALVIVRWLYILDVTSFSAG